MISGLSMPNLKKLADAYGLRYLAIETIAETDAIVKKALVDDEPTVIEIFSDMETQFVPIVKSRMDKDGHMTSSRLEDMYPFLPQAEQQDNERGW